MKKKKIKSFLVRVPTMSGQEDLLLATRHQILMENHESLKQDYASLEQRCKLVEEMNAINLRLLKDERDRNAGKDDGNKEMVEKLEARNEELLLVLEKQEEELRKRESKYEEFQKRFVEIEKECSVLKSLYDDDGAKKLNNVGLEDEVFVVNHNNNNTVADPIVLSDESDAENDSRPTRESNIHTPLPVVVKQEEEEEGSNGVNSSQVKHPPSASSKVKRPSSSSKVKRPPSSSKVKRPSSSSSSSSSDDVYLVSVKRSRDDDFNKTL